MFYIYLIVNKVNGKTYVGQHKSSSKEWYEDKYMGSGKLLKKAKQKYGIENFEKFLIQYCYSKEETDKAEIFWIAEYRRRGKAEYNIADGGAGGTSKGKHWKLSEEVKKKHSEANKGKHRTDEQRRRISEARKGKYLTEETRRKLSEKLKGRVSPYKGKHHTEEQKRKMSEAQKGKHLSEETKRKIGEARKGKKVSWKVKHWKLVDGKRVYYKDMEK